MINLSVMPYINHIWRKWESTKARSCYPLFCSVCQWNYWGCLWSKTNSTNTFVWCCSPIPTYSTCLGESHIEFNEAYFWVGMYRTAQQKSQDLPKYSYNDGWELNNINIRWPGRRRRAVYFELRQKAICTVLTKFMHV